MSDKKTVKGKTRMPGEGPSAAAGDGVKIHGNGAAGGLADDANSNGTANGYHSNGPSATGTDADTDNTLRCTSLLNLEVKVLTQPLGAENQWAERGDGRVEFVDFTIRVVASKLASSSAGSSTASAATAGAKDKNKSPNTDGVKADSNAGTPGRDEVVIIEDTITSDTPFVGENCCIVWNSFEQQLSLCLMYASNEGYSASWSALVALQDKAYPALPVDLLSHCLSVEERRHRPNAEKAGEDGGESLVLEAENEALLPPGVLPYSYFINNKYDPPLGFIENHSLSICIMEHNHALRKQMYEDRDTILALLGLANADLLELLLTKDMYPMVVEGLGYTENIGGLATADWAIPDGLTKLSVPEDLAAIVSKDLRLTHLQQKVLLPVDNYTDLILRLSTISHRLRNEITCTLLSNDATLRQAREALMVQPPITASAAAAVRHRHSGDLSSASPSTSSESNSLSSAGGSTAAVIDSCVRAERQVLAHLHFFRSLISLTLAELGKELVTPVVVKVFQSGLFEALSLVAERFALPNGAAQPFLAALQDGGSSSGGGGGGGNATNNNPSNNANRRGSTTTANWYSPAIEAELAMLLDVSLVRLNERQEEQLMNELVRAPVLSDPVKYNGIITFMLRQLALGNAGATAVSTTMGMAPMAAVAGLSVGRGGRKVSGTTAGGAGRPRVMHENMSTCNPYILFHVLGLHDDEGSATMERCHDGEITDTRNRFQNFIITKYLFQASRGSLVPVPLPPATGPNGQKSAPIIQFNNMLGFNNMPQGISPPFIRTLEYLINLATNENRESMLKIVFNHKSHIMHYIEACCELAAKNHRSVGLDVLSTCMRFLRTVISHVAFTERSEAQESTSLNPSGSPREPLPKALVTTICRQLTVERDTFGIVLDTYHKIGGTRCNTIFHSAVLSLLELIDRHVPTIKDISDADDAAANNDLRDIRDYLFLKHLNLLPSRFERKFRESLLAEVSSRLGRDSYTPNDSVSVLSSTASEMLRSSSKLRFVDEVEAATGGVDGTVLPEMVANLSPVVVGNVHSSEEKMSKKLRTMELLGVGTGSGSGSAGGGSPSPFRPISPGTNAAAGPMQPSPPAAVHIARPGSGGGRPLGAAKSSPPALTSSGSGGNPLSMQDGNGSGSRLKPVMPSYDKPAGLPRSGGGVAGRSSSEGAISTEEHKLSGGAASTGSTPSPLTAAPTAASNAMMGSASASLTTSTVSGKPTSAASAGSDASAGGAKTGGTAPGSSADALVLPKIRKRTTASTGRR